MVMIRHELKEGRITLLIWTAVIAFMLSLCILIYPEMEMQMGDVSSIFAKMGGFSAAFGMDRLNFGEFTGFFGVECGNASVPCLFHPTDRGGFRMLRDICLPYTGRRRNRDWHGRASLLS